MRVSYVLPVVDERFVAIFLAHAGGGQRLVAMPSAQCHPADLRPDHGIEPMDGDDVDICACFIPVEFGFETDPHSGTLRLIGCCSDAPRRLAKHA